MKSRERKGRERTRQAAPEDTRTARDPDSATVAAWSTRRGGEALDAPIRTRLERSFDAKLGGVRVHRDRFAHDATAQVGAPALAAGRNVFFAPDTYAPTTTSGQQLIAHEVAHTLQGRGRSPSGGMSRPSDPAEQEAHHAAIAGAAGAPFAIRERTPARVMRAPVHTETPFGVGRSGLRAKEGTQSESYYDEKTGLTAEAWALKHHLTLYGKLAAALATTSLQPGSPFLSWAAGGQAAFARALLTKAFAVGMAKAGLRAAWAGLVLILEPDRVDLAIDQARDSYPATYGPPDWNDAVIDELLLLLKKRVVESFGRLSPRYTRLKNQHLMRVEQGKPADEASVPPAEMFFEHAIDACVLAGFEEGVKLDTAWLRSAFPEQAKPQDIAAARTVELYFQSLVPHTAPRSVRADPADATMSEVGAALYGSTSESWRLTDLHPYFLFDPTTAGMFSGKYRGKLLAITVGLSTAENSGLSSETAKDHARQVEPTPGLRANEQGKQIIAARYSDMIRFLTSAETKLAAYKEKSKGIVAPHIIKDFATKRSILEFQVRPYDSPDKVISLDQVSIVQRDTLLQVTNGVSSACNLASAFDKWPRVTEILDQVLESFQQAVDFSEFVGVGAQYLAVADRRLRQAPADILDAMLEQLRRSTIAAETDKTKLHIGDRYDNKWFREKERALEKSIFALRELVLLNPEGARTEIERIIKELGTLQTGVTIVANMDAIDSAWRSLFESLSTVGVIHIPGVYDSANQKRSRGMAAALEMNSEWHAIYRKWKFGDEKAKQEAADELKKKSDKDSKWQKFFTDIYDIIDSAQTLDMWTGFGIMLGLAIVTAGIGTLVSAGVEAAYGATAAFVAATVTEATFMTVMNSLVFEKDFSWGRFGWSFAKNLFTFGILRGISVLYVWRVGEVAAGTVAGQFKLLLLQFAAQNVISLVEADVEKRLRTGKGLSIEEIITLSLQNLAFTAAVMLGTKLVKPGIEAMHVFGKQTGTMWRIGKLRAEVGEVTARMEASKGKDPALYDEQLVKVKTLLDLENKAITELELLAANPKTTKHLSPKNIKDIQDTRARHTESANEYRRARLGHAMRAIGEDALAVPRSDFLEARSFYEEVENKKIVDLTADPVTGARAFQVELEGRMVTVVERTAPAEAIDQPLILRNKPAPTPEQVAANKARASEARSIDAQRREELKTLVDADPSPTFKRIVIGGGSAAVTNVATLPPGAGSRCRPVP